MQANRKFRNDRAEVGVGTLIVFIAMVLVAAVAAAVLINTSGTLQERAQATGKEATEEVSSNIKIVGVYGVRNGTASTDDITTLKINTELSAGAPDIDLTRVVIRFSDGTNTYNYVYGEWVPNWIRGTNETAVMEAGDLVELEFDLGAEIEERTEIEILIIPEAGAPVIADFETPPTYGGATSVTLR